MFRRVALRVNREIGQDPWMSASTLPEVYFAGQPSAAPPAAAAKLTEAAEAWDRVKDSSNAALFEAFLVRYRDTFYADWRARGSRKSESSSPRSLHRPPHHDRQWRRRLPLGDHELPSRRPCLGSCTQGRSRHDGRPRLRFRAISPARLPPLQGGGANFRRRALAQQHSRSPERSGSALYKGHFLPNRKACAMASRNSEGGRSGWAYDRRTYLVTRQSRSRDNEL